MLNSDSQSGATTSAQVPKRTAVNLDASTWTMVHDEAKRANPDEKPNMSMMTRTLIREAINARKAKRKKST